MPVIERFQRSVFARPSGGGQQITDPGLARAGAALVNAPGQAALQRGIQSVDQAFEQIAVDLADTEATEAFNKMKAGGLDQFVSDTLARTGEDAEKLNSDMKTGFEKHYNSGTKDLSNLSRRKFRALTQQYAGQSFARGSQVQTRERVKRVEAAKISDLENTTDAALKTAESVGYAPGAVSAGEADVRASVAAASEGKGEAYHDTLEQTTIDRYYRSAFDALRIDGRVNAAEDMLEQGKASGMSHDAVLAAEASIKNSTDQGEVLQEFDKHRGAADLNAEIEKVRRNKSLEPKVRTSVVDMLKSEINYKASVQKAAVTTNDRYVTEQIDQLLVPLSTSGQAVAPESRAQLNNLLNQIRNSAAFDAQKARVDNIFAGGHITQDNRQHVAFFEDVLARPNAQKYLNEVFIPDGLLEQMTLSPDTRKDFNKKVKAVADNGVLPFDDQVMKDAKNQFEFLVGTKTSKSKSANARWDALSIELSQAFGNETRRSGGKPITPERRKEITDFFLLQRPQAWSFGGFTLLELSSLTDDEKSRIDVPAQHRDLAIKEARAFEELNPRNQVTRPGAVFDSLSNKGQRQAIQRAYVRALDEVLSDKRGAF